MPTAFVTGCATGFGHALTRRLLADGWHVVATDPEIEGLEQALLKGIPAKSRLLVLRMDLADPPGIRSAVWEALEWQPVDVLVNNGGYAVFANQEEADLVAVEKMFAVNLFGAMHVTKALLPTLRLRQGTVVNISSVAGRMSFPESGFYAASKHALEAISEALFEETCSFGMRVRIVEPGSFATNFQIRAMQMSEPRAWGSPYEHLFHTWDVRKVEALEAPQDPQLVVEAIVQSLEDRKPFMRVRVGPDAERILGLRDAIDHDAWVVLMARRNGTYHGISGPGDVLSPIEVVSYGVDGPAEVFEPTEAAWHAGHLGFWDETPEGEDALRVLVARATPKAVAPTPPTVTPDVLALARELSDTKKLTAAANAAAEAVARITGANAPALAVEAAQILATAKPKRSTPKPRKSPKAPPVPKPSKG